MNLEFSHPANVRTGWEMAMGTDLGLPITFTCRQCASSDQLPVDTGLWWQGTARVGSAVGGGCSEFPGEFQMSRPGCQLSSLPEPPTECGPRYPTWQVREGPPTFAQFGPCSWLTPRHQL